MGELVEVIEKVKAEPALYFSGKVSLEQIEKACREAAGKDVDVGTDKGRKAIASRARIPVSVKTTLDDAGKQMNEERRRQINEIDAARRVARDRLDALRDELRQPLTDYEREEEERKQARLETIAEIDEHAALARDVDATVEDLHAALQSITGIKIGDNLFGSRVDEINERRADAVRALEAAIVRRQKADEEAAELEALRQKERERQEREAEEARQREAQEAAKRREEQERARIQAEEKARADREAQEKIEAANREAAELRRKEEERETRERAEREAAEARQRDEDHKAAVRDEAISGLLSAADVELVTAEAIIRQIEGGNVPHVKIEW